MRHFMEVVFSHTKVMMMMMASFQVMLGCVVVEGSCSKAMFVFGDGTVDVGNNNYLPPDPARADFPYYGIDFPGSKPTGRFSNGYNLADFVAKNMGFQKSPPAYLSLNSSIKMAANFTGVNYASAGAGILNIINDDVTIPFHDQVDNFNATVSQMKDNLLGHKYKELIISRLLAKSFFLVSVGTTDLSYNILLRSRPRTPRRPVPPSDDVIIQNILSSYKARITALHALGARKFGVINVQPFGCQPWMRNHGDCNDAANSLAREFNNGLVPILANLSSQLAGLSYSIADLYGFSNATFVKPSAYGFVNINSTCCNPPCTPEHEPPCENRRQYWFWDLSYMTEQAARLAAAAFYDGPARFTVPVNFKRLGKKK